jgi:hypothetical protein
MLTTIWTHVEKALKFLREHFSEEIYARYGLGVKGGGRAGGAMETYSFGTHLRCQ